MAKVVIIETKKPNKLKDWTVKELKNEALALDQLINEIGCYGTKDIINLDLILRELSNRGYKAVKHYKFS